MRSTDTIRLELERYANRPVVFAVQGDTETRYVEIMLLRNGVSYRIPDGVTAELRCRRADGAEIVRDELETAGGMIVLELSEEMLAVPGIAECTVTLSEDAGEIGTTQPFRLKVQYSPGAAKNT